MKCDWNARRQKQEVDHEKTTEKKNEKEDVIKTKNKEK